MFGRMGLISTGPRPTPTWMEPGSAFHIKPRSWSYIDGTEFTSFTNYVNTPSAGVFARASKAYGLTSTGTFTTFASGVPAVTDLGLLMEVAETNLIGYSMLPDAGGTNTNVTVTTGQEGAFGNGAVLITGNGASGAHNKAYGANTYTSGTPYIIYGIVEDLSSGCLQIWMPSACFGTQVYANFDLSGDGATGTKGTNTTTSGILKLATGRFLIWITATATGTAAGAVAFALVAATNSARNLSSTSTASFIISGYQVVANATTWSSPIDTNGVDLAPQSRAAVSLTIKPPADTYDITYKFGDGTADQTVTGVVIGAGGYEIPLPLNGRFITDIIGVPS